MKRIKEKLEDVIQKAKQDGVSIIDLDNTQMEYLGEEIREETIRILEHYQHERDEMQKEGRKLDDT